MLSPVRAVLYTIGSVIAVIALVVGVTSPTTLANAAKPLRTVTATVTRTVTATVTQTVTATATVTQTVTASPSQTPTSQPTTSPPTTSTPPAPGGFPNATNTGTPAGTTLTAYTGPMIITTAGTVIDSKSITGDLRIQAMNVTVKNSSIFGDVRIDPGFSGASFTVQDTTINAGPANGSAAYDGTGIGARDFTALRVHVYGGKRGINCYSNCTVRDSYIHGQSDPTNNEHESGIRMGSFSTIIHNTIACDAPNMGTDGGCSADLTGYGDFDPVHDNLIQGNFFKAQTGGGTCAYGGASGGKPYSNDSHDIRFFDNVFERGTQKSDHGLYVCGYYSSSMDFDTDAPGNQWSGNTYDDGTPVGPNSTV